MKFAVHLSVSLLVGCLIVHIIPQLTGVVLIGTFILLETVGE
jgi:hypothetical protein